ncbi:MAG TPA: response regulator, partial [Polyangiales bacterium]|nr:response regulator [Polyangiales bacterium]
MTDSPKPNVLIVDDIEANLVALEAALGTMECELVRASNGNDALRCLLKREFAVMLLDVQMPGMDGYEVARYARANSATRDVPIIFLTAMNKTEANVLRGYGTGAVDFLFKPVNVDILRGKVSVFLELYEGRRKLANEVASHKKTLASLEQANEALRHFTNAASHDLRAPLRAVEGFMQALDEHLGPDFDAEARDYLMRSRRAAQRMDSLLRSLLAYARLQKPADHTRVKCKAVVDQVRADLAEAISASGAELTVEELP